MNKGKAAEILERRYNKQNQYNKEKYDRITVMLPKGKKEEIKQLIGDESVNEFIKQSVDIMLNNISLFKPQKSTQNATEKQIPNKLSLKEEINELGQNTRLELTEDNHDGYEWNELLLEWIPIEEDVCNKPIPEVLIKELPPIPGETKEEYNQRFLKKTLEENKRWEQEHPGEIQELPFN